LLREARRLAWPRAWIERTLAALYALCAIAPLDASAPATHVALAGALESGAALVREADACWEAAGDDPARARWRRDRALLSVASSARAKRIERAWERIAEKHRA
jgi:acyl-CoA dehydrogenase